MILLCAILVLICLLLRS